MKILLTGLPDTVNETGLRNALEKFGEILEIKIIKEGSRTPWALVDFNVTREQAAAIAQKIDGIYHDGRFIGAQVRLHV